ncbi:hypothetical protein RND81_10G131800 [Saponaria officinalis]|uniref:Uncharacterized protein n=1 Tax=Saponaria officinalis TaxID=3572 RepID=A0AAW1I2U9_SAPOF
MVLVKRTLDNRLNSCDSPVVPRAPRSVRKRKLCQKSREGSQLCAFELLATVAGKLLEECECSSTSSSAAVRFDQRGIGKDGIKSEPQDAVKPLGGEPDDLGSSEGSLHFSGFQKGICEEKFDVERVSPGASSVCSEKVEPKFKLTSLKNNDDFVKLTSKIIRDFPFDGESDDTNVEIGLNRKVDMADKSSTPTNSEEYAELPFRRETVPNDSFFERVNGVKIGFKGDDEIRSRCSQPNNIKKIFRSLKHSGDQRFRKPLTSKTWKTVPKLKDCEVTNSGGGANHVYEIDRSQRDTPFKKRRIFDSSVVTHDGGISCESVSNSPEKSSGDDKNALAGTMHEGNKEKLPSGFRRQNSCNSTNSHVRLSIKSFKVPELFVEVPESTTVGSLKTTVLEAVKSILGEGLRVGILLHGKKIRDDNRTLVQTGISRNDDMDTVGFMLEPNSPTQPSSLIPKQPCAPLLSETPKFVNRSRINVKEENFILGPLNKPYATVTDSRAESSRNLVPSAAVESPNKNIPYSKALVPVPEPLDVSPVNQKSKHSEIGHRRTRRPFSVSEVEALVHAVEKLGTGRWRDVKLCSFENAKHRTYVDLKDKWKTLVHTARISPQQRRGEPVPQGLLDRVLAAQAYWSEHQTKQHGKQNNTTLSSLNLPPR